MSKLKRQRQRATRQKISSIAQSQLRMSLRARRVEQKVHKLPRRLDTVAATEVQELRLIVTGAMAQLHSQVNYSGALTTRLMSKFTTERLSRHPESLQHHVRRIIDGTTTKLKALRREATLNREEIASLQHEVGHWKSLVKCSLCQGTTPDVAISCGHMYCNPCITQHEQNHFEATSLTTAVELQRTIESPGLHEETVSLDQTERVGDFSGSDTELGTEDGSIHDESPCPKCREPYRVFERVALHRQLSSSQIVVTD